MTPFEMVRQKFPGTEWNTTETAGLIALGAHETLRSILKLPGWLRRES